MILRSSQILSLRSRRVPRKRSTARKRSAKKKRKQSMGRTTDKNGSVKKTKREIHTATPKKEYKKPARAKKTKISNQSSPNSDVHTERLKAVRKLNVTSFVKSLLREVINNEKKYIDHYVPIYHVYCSSAVIYEIYSALAAVLLDWEGDNVLPRLHTSPFLLAPNALTLREKLKSFVPTLTSANDDKWGNDHNNKFRSIAIAGNTSLFHGSEANPINFSSGYCACGVSGIINDVFDKTETMPLKEKVRKLAMKYEYPLEAFGPGQWKSIGRGSLLQIFVRKDIIDAVGYACFAYGKIDHDRSSIRKALECIPPKHGQCRLSANPKVFMDPELAKVFHFSSDKKRHNGRMEFQNELRSIFKDYYENNQEKKLKAIRQFLNPLPSTLMYK